MPNQWNDLVQGLIQGGLAVNQGLLNKSYKEDAKTEYDTYRKGLVDQYGKLMKSNQDLLNSFSPKVQQEGTNIGLTTPMGKPTQFNPMDALDQLMNFQGKMVGNPYGEQYSKMGEQMYNTLLNKKPKKVNTYFDSKNNLMITYDDNGRILGTNQYAPEEKKPEKRTAEDYGSMGFEDALKLNPDELENAFYYFPKETQDKLKENPYFQQLSDKFFKTGDFTPKISGRYFRTGKPKQEKEILTPKDKNIQRIAKSLDEVKATIEGYGGWESLDDEDKSQASLKEKYGKLSNELKGYGIDNPDQFVVDYASNPEKYSELLKGSPQTNYKESDWNPVGNEKNYYGQIQNWQDKIEQAWGRYDLTPEDWVGEATKHGLFDGEIDEDYLLALKQWFRDKTGKDLTDYVDIGK